MGSEPDPSSPQAEAEAAHVQAEMVVRRRAAPVRAALNRLSGLIRKSFAFPDGASGPRAAPVRVASKTAETREIHTTNSLPAADAPTVVTRTATRPSSQALRPMSVLMQEDLTKLEGSAETDAGEEAKVEPLPLPDALPPSASTAPAGGVDAADASLSTVSADPVVPPAFVVMATVDEDESEPIPLVDMVTVDTSETDGAPATDADKGVAFAIIDENLV